MNKLDWLEYRNSKEMIVNIPSSEGLDCSRPIIGCVTDLTTGERFYFDWIETIPFYPGTWEVFPNYAARVYGDDDACLIAVRHTSDGEIIGLHPSRVSESDQAMLSNLYRVLGFAQGVIDN